MIASVTVLGGGSAGYLAALTVKRRNPSLQVKLVQSDKIGIIGVGEGTTAYFPNHLFEYLKLNPKKFYEIAQTTWKLGIRFLWGKKGCFYYPLSKELDVAYAQLSSDPGYYLEDNFTHTGIASACMLNDTAFPCMPNSKLPDLRMPHAFHIENHRLVEWLAETAQAMGVMVEEGTMASVEQHDNGDIAALIMEDGRRMEADFFVDASGFRSELLRGVYKEPWVDYSNSLFCDAAWIAGWSRHDDEPLRPYTTAETMDAGWCWQIEHDNWINRGYVFSQKFLSEEDALAEFRRKNPRIENEPRLVKFQSGRTRNAWVNNVAGVGNSTGFVEPLEATALHIVCLQCNRIAEMLANTRFQPGPSMAKLYNTTHATAFDDVRDFLAVHYAFNELIDTPFWQACRNDTDLGGAAPIVEFYQDNGPCSSCHDWLIPSTNQFGLEGYFHMLLGQGVPYKQRDNAVPDKERQLWKKHLDSTQKQAQMGLPVQAAFKEVTKSSWKWNRIYT